MASTTGRDRFSAADGLTNGGFARKGTPTGTGVVALLVGLARVPPLDPDAAASVAAAAGVAGAGDGADADPGAASTARVLVGAEDPYSLKRTNGTDFT